MKTFSWWRYRAAECAVALVMVAAAVYLIDNIQARQRAGVAAQNWLTVNDIYVPDHEAGSNPEITYDRTIKEPFQGFWVVEVQRRAADGTFVLECSGSGINDYEPQDYIPNNIVRWSWFIGKSCSDIPAGTYRIRASWTLRRAGWPEKQLVAYSNIFRVLLPSLNR
jgi:hypothetical protein